MFITYKGLPEPVDINKQSTNSYTLFVYRDLRVGSLQTLKKMDNLKEKLKEALMPLCLHIARVDKGRKLQCIRLFQ